MSEHPIPVGIFAASSIVPQIEFAAGIEHLKKFGFDPRIDPQVAKHHFMFPGSDEERAEAIYRFALNPTIPVLWAALSVPDWNRFFGVLWLRGPMLPDPLHALA